MIIKDGKEYRNLQEQVQKNKEDIEALQVGGIDIDLQQQSGTSTTAVMSQNAITNYVDYVGTSVLTNAKSYADIQTTSANTYTDNQIALINENIEALQTEVFGGQVMLDSEDFSAVLTSGTDEITATYSSSDASITMDGVTTAGFQVFAPLPDKCIVQITPIFNTITSSAYLPIMYKTGDYFYCLRFMGDGTIKIQRVAQGSGAGTAIATLTANSTALSTYTSGDVIKWRFDSVNHTIDVYKNDELAVTVPDNNTYTSASTYYVGVWVVSTVSTMRPTYKCMSGINCVIDEGETVEDKIASVSQDVETTNKRFGVTKYFHYSFDDVTLCLQDITTNASTYTSIFNNAFFAWLKDMHDKYGACVSLYVFYQNGTDTTASTYWDLTDCTNKFASEFTANSDWLRFGYHAYNPSINMANTSAETATTYYTNVINELYRITGSIDCIDRIPRFHNYAGNKDAMIAMRDCPCGIMGALTAMDTSTNVMRESYYFNDEQNNYIFKHCMMYDANNQLTFVKTAYNILYNVNNYIKTPEYASLRNYIEAFLHEVELSTGIKSSFEAIFKIFTQNGYESKFWMDMPIANSGTIAIDENFTISETHTTGGNVTLSATDGKFGDKITLSITCDSGYTPIATLNGNSITLTQNTIISTKYTATLTPKAYKNIVNVTFTATT